jgi:hypothetical protein
MNVTVPLGELLGAVTVAVSPTICPNTVGFGETANVVVVEELT